MDGVIEAPGPVDLRMKRGLVAILSLQLVDNSFYVLCAAQWQHEHSVHRSDDGEAFDAQHGDKGPVG